MRDIHPPIVIQTENGWEPASWCESEQDYFIEPGFAKPTREEAQADLDKSIAESQAAEAADRRYQAQYAYACGYHD